MSSKTSMSRGRRVMETKIRTEQLYLILVEAARIGSSVGAADDRLERARPSGSGADDRSRVAASASHRNCYESQCGA